MEEKTKLCPYCGETIFEVAVKCKHCGEWLNNNLSGNPVITKIANCQRVSNILWLIIGIIQICSIICIIAGIWNIIAVCNNWKFPQKILNQDSDIPGYYEGIAGLIILVVVNFLLGGLIGVILIGFDFYIRGLVLDNKQMFNKGVVNE